MSIFVVLVVGGVATVAVVWAVILNVPRLDALHSRASLRAGLLPAGLFGAAIWVLVTASLNGRQFLGGPVDLGSALFIGFSTAMMAGCIYLLIGALLFVIGTLAGLGRRWSIAGTWFTGAALIALFLVSLILLT
jgi:hypothetical protein